MKDLSHGGEFPYILVFLSNEKLVNALSHWRCELVLRGVPNAMLGFSGMILTSVRDSSSYFGSRVVLICNYWILGLLF